MEPSKPSALPPLTVQPNLPLNVLTITPQTEIKKKPGYIKKVLLGVLGVIIFMVLLGAIWYFFSAPILSLFAHDITPIDDKDLLPAAIKIPDETNAFFDLNEIEKVASDSATVIDYIALKKWNDGDVQQILAKNKEAFARWDSASKKSSFQDPYFQDSTTIPADFNHLDRHIYTGYQKVARLNVLRGLMALKQGNAQDGFNVLFENLMIGQKLQQPGSGLIATLVGTGIKSIGIRGLETALPYIVLPKTAALQLEKQFDNFPFNSESLKEGFRQEYFVASYRIDALASGKTGLATNSATFVGESSTDKKIAELAKNKFYLEPNKTKKLYADFFRTQLTSVDLPCTNLSDVPFSRDVNIVTNMYFRENGLGILLFNVGGTAFSGLIQSKCDYEADIGITKLLIALRSYQADKKSLPSNLSQLVPDYISSVPIDPYGGVAFKYSDTKKILYSIGRNKKDDNGDGEFQSIMALDYIIPLNF